MEVISRRAKGAQWARYIAIAVLLVLLLVGAVLFIPSPARSGARATHPARAARAAHTARADAAAARKDEYARR